MAHIIAVSVEGLAGRRDTVQFTFQRHLNVFYGLNGSGKTSLLKILHSAMENDGSALEGTAFVAATVRLFSVAADLEIIRTIRKRPPDTQAEQDSAEAASRHWDFLRQAKHDLGIKSPISWQTDYVGRPDKELKGLAHTFLPTSRLYAGIAEALSPAATLGRGFGGALASDDMLDQVFAKSLVTLWRQYTVRVSSLVQAAQAKGLASILNAFLAPKKRRAKLDPADPAGAEDPAIAHQRVGAFLGRQGSPEIIGSLAQFSRRLRNDERLQQVVQDISEVERAIAEAMQPRTRLSEVVGELVAGGKTLEFRDERIVVRSNDGPEIPLTTLSSGEKHLLRILVEVIGGGGNTILIDEPEISMHVDWQSRFIGVARLLNSDAQLVLATHSPEIAAEVPDANLFRV